LLLIGVGELIMKMILAPVVTLAIGFIHFTGSTGIHPIETGRPALLIDQAITIANRYASTHSIAASQHYIDSVSLENDDVRGKFWSVTWLPNQRLKGGEIYMQIYMDKSITVRRGR
jgi:hypothetical protein